MAPNIQGLALLALNLMLVWRSAVSQVPNQPCVIPEEYHGDWYTQEAGVDTQTIVNAEKWEIQGSNAKTLQCTDMHIHPFTGITVQDGRNATMLMKEMNVAPGTTVCFFCVDVLWRTPNILQYRKEDCVRSGSGFDISLNASCKGMKANYGLPTTDDAITMFRLAPKKVNCISTFEGVYQFSYEVDVGGGGICNNPLSQIEACQDPGSAYVDNEVFMMTYAKCPDVSTSRNEQTRYQCMGTWFARRSGRGYTYAAIADTVEKDTREKFKCLMTLKNQKDANNQIRWVMSRFPDCSKLNSIYNGPTKFVLTRIPPVSDYMTPKCNLPRNITGTWFTQGDAYRSNVKINETHITFKTAINEFEYQEVFYSCQQTLGTRFLMTKVTVGKCEKDFVCFDLMPRHHSIVRYRVGKPNRLTEDEKADPNYLTKKFREACSWMSFTFNRDDTDWKYNVLILNPPSPVPCPVAGRYQFEQMASRQEEKYSTRIRGVTKKPRVQVDCRIIVSEMKSCSNDMTKIEVDAEYCETVDYRGRPIGEYDVSDHILMCVGFWMEDYRSYLITWDEEDAISAFRCWVYERTSWTDVMMSRSQNARCPRAQTAQDYMMAGTGLSLRMTESERLFDDCPQRFDPGINPYKKPTTIYVLSKSNAVSPSKFFLVLAACLLFFIH
ncbi:uncharacterized protein LOC132561872 [Ylistrum balloti]|uniref:uncharacterized protein LOC132561872 n=1 Tax=Ylistrum balloti TaxID=509963 RepID=UPI0029059A59|nr:uncharacterized protein LOC132561872 [Ylistrum balloti]